MSNDLTLAMRLYLESRQFTGGLRQSERAVTGFTGKAKRELGELKRMFGGIKGQMASLGIAFGAGALVKQSAGLDKSLTQTRQTAEATTKQARELRTELFRMSKDTGQGLDDLKGGYDNLIQSGLDWQQSLATIDAINPAMAVTSANAQVLASGLTVAAQAFQFDLAKPKLAVDLLDKMVVAGRLGNAELEDLSGIFARVGVNAKTANLSFDQTLGFIEQLSLIEKNPERLATLADSTLRLFTNEQYKKTAQSKLRVKFYNDDGSSRAAFDVLKDIQGKYQTLKTDKQRAAFIQAGFGKTDLDTQKGIRTLLGGQSLAGIDKMVGQISTAGGTIARDLPDAINNAVDQTGRLKASLREAADEFAKPINGAISEAIKYGMGKDGLNLSGKEMIGGGLALVGGTALAARYGGKAISAVGGKLFGTASGVATGKALEEMAGVTPVYVVNMPGGGISGNLPAIPGMPALPKTISGARAAAGLLFGAESLGTIGSMGAGAVGTAGLVVAGAGAAGYGVGTAINKTVFEGNESGDQMGRFLNKIAAALGNEESKRAVAAEQRQIDESMKRMYARDKRSEVDVRLTVEADDNLKAAAKSMQGSGGAEVEVDAGGRM